MDYVTSGLELAGVLSILACVSLAVFMWAGLPVALLATGVTCWAFSWVLQGAKLPKFRRKGGK